MEEGHACVHTACRVHSACMVHTACKVHKACMVRHVRPARSNGHAWPFILYVLTSPASLCSLTVESDGAVVILSCVGQLDLEVVGVSVGGCREEGKAVQCSQCRWLRTVHHALQAGPNPRLCTGPNPRQVQSQPTHHPPPGRARLTHQRPPASPSSDVCRSHPYRTVCSSSLDS